MTAAVTGRGRRILLAVASVAVLVALVVTADADRRLVDLTEDDTLTLSDQTRDVVGALDRDVDVTLFARPSDPGRVEAISLLDRYRRLSNQIDVEVLNPDENPGELNRLGVDPLLGGVAIRRGEQIEVVPFATEGDLTGALARLVRDTDILVCSTTGHGERRLGDETGRGLSALGGLLERDGYQVTEIDVLATPEVPPECSVVLVAAPTGAFGDAATDALAAWLDADGRLLVLTDPLAETVPLADALDDVGLAIEAGVVLEGDAGNVVGGDVSAPIVTRYPSANPVTRALAPTFFPVVQEVTVDDDTDEAGLTLSRLAQTSETSYLERNPVEPDFDPTTDRPGPVTIAAAADRSRVDDVDVRRTRVVAVGDVDFATNDVIGEAGNAQFLRQSVAWLTETEDLVAISPNLPRVRPLRLTDARASYALVLSAGVVPGMFLLTGAMVWALRRGR